MSDMTNELRRHVELLFEAAPKSNRSFDLKEELLANLTERYNDLTARGVVPEDAYKNVVDSIGDVNELLKGLETPPTFGPEEQLARQKRSALITAIAVGLYFLAGIGFFAFGLTPNLEEWSVVAALVLSLPPTCLLVYNAYAYPKYQQHEDTVVEEFRAWNSNQQSYKAVRGAVSSILWTLVLLVYFVVSFVTFAWYITWVIFLVGACLQSAVNLFFHIREMK